MSDLFNDIFETGVFPEGWCRGVIIPLYKKGVRSDPNNYRGITLLDVFGKVFCAILNKRLYVWAEDIGSISSCQSGFRKGFSTMDNIFTLYAIIQNYLRKRRGKFFCLFVDFAKAFDSVNYHYLFIKLQSIGLSGKMFNIIKSMYDDVKSCVKLDRGISEYFNCGIGVRQGSVLSPVLFSLFIDELYQIITKAGFKGVQLTQDMFDLFVLLYADDVVIFADTVVGLQRLINCLGQFCDKWKLKANFKKTKVVTFRKGGHSSRNEKWHLNGTSIEVVSYYNYLGLLLSCRNKWSKAVSNLADQARKAMFSIFSFERKVGVITHEVYFKLFDSLILPILLYGSELWGFQQFMQIEMVQLKYCKHFLGVRQNTTNEAVLGDCGRTPIFVKSLTRCIKYWLRLTELPDNRVAKHAYKLMLKIDESGHTSWATEVKNILQYYGFGIVWVSQGVGDTISFVTEFSQRVSDIYKQNWFSDVCSKESLNTYCNFKSVLEPEKYLLQLSDVRYRHALARIRCGSHKLRIQEGRHSGLDITERICEVCSEGIEDEFHFLLVCPLYQTVREALLPQYYWIFPTRQKFFNLMNVQSAILLRNLGKFIYKAMYLREEFYSS